MVQIATINDTPEIASKFGAAIKAKYINLITSLLADDGKFETQDEQLDTN